jgi:membrane-associated protease RseP (regulator of RpoE activity)
MIISFLISLYITIILHEFGHLITAKLCGCGVPTYSVGFGKILLHKKIGKTDYQLRLLPLGGYCELEGEMATSKKENAYVNLIYRKKLLIALAGCLINIISGLIVYAIGYYFDNRHMLYFGIISTMLGITNLLPIPALDGSYPYLFLLEKIIPKKYALQLTKFLITWGFNLIMLLNILSIPWLIINWKKF